MKISIVRMVRYAVFPLMLGAVLSVSQSLRAQPTEDREITRLNRTLKGRVSSPTFDGIVWSNVNIYKVGGEYLQRISKLISRTDTTDIAQVNAIGLTLFDEPHPDLYGLISRVGSRAQWDPNKRFEDFRKQIAKETQMDDPEDIDADELRRAANITLTVKQAKASRPSTFYLVTSRDSDRPRLIALLGVSGSELDGNLRVAGDNWVWAGTELYEQLRSNGADVTLYDDIKSEVKDKTGQALANRTYALRSFDSIDLAPRTHARATYLDEKQYAYVLTSISEGRPLRDEPKVVVEDSLAAGGGFGDFGGLDIGGSSKGVLAGALVPGTGEYPYELTLGTDVIAAFRSYDIRNKKEPILQWGVELRNNFDEINYPSLWGGRLTLSAMLENIKLGAVMPHIRFGDSTIGTSGFGKSQQHIIGGWGAAISGDFDAPVLDNSGLFNFYASYTFSESFTDKLSLSNSKLFDGVVSVVDDFGSPGDVANLIRFAAQGYYSFGFYLDDYAKHMVRLKIGGTVYGVDFYRRSFDPNVLLPASEVVDTTFVLTKVRSTDINGGVSGKIEYMKGGTKYPFGASLQYIDQSILANAWIQFIVSQRIDLKFDLKFFTPVFREPWAWENPSLTVPSLTFKYHFGTPPADPSATSPF